MSIMPKNWEARQKKLAARRGAMPMNGRGLITVTLPTLAKKSKKVKRVHENQAVPSGNRAG
jgi:hypothetical protein